MKSFHGSLSWPSSLPPRTLKTAGLGRGLRVSNGLDFSCAEAQGSRKEAAWTVMWHKVLRGPGPPGRPNVAKRPQGSLGAVLSWTMSQLWQCRGHRWVNQSRGTTGPAQRKFQPPDSSVPSKAELFRMSGSVGQRNPTFSVPGTGVMEDNFSMEGVGRRWFPMIQRTVQPRSFTCAVQKGPTPMRLCVN